MSPGVPDKPPMLMAMLPGCDPAWWVRDLASARKWHLVGDDFHCAPEEFWDVHLPASDFGAAAQFINDIGTSPAGVSIDPQILKRLAAYRPLSTPTPEQP